MKFIIALSILFLWMAIDTPILCKSSGDCEAVVDIEGKNLQPNVPYYIWPVARSGGLGLTAGDGQVVQLQMNSEAAEGMGIPVTFQPVNASDNVVCLSADTQVAFSNSIQTTAWTLASDGVRLTSDVLIDDEAGETSGLPNWFKIEKYHYHPHHHHHHHHHKHHHHHHHHHYHLCHHDCHHHRHRYYYKLAFCPSTIGGGSYGDKCGDLGIFAEDDGKRWLGLNGSTPFPVVFKKA
ncbi:hypothetical protein ACLOJK_017083 [Asimina triloba]